MNKAFWAYKLHKWLALLIGLQMTIWLVSGLYLVLIAIWLSISGILLLFHNYAPRKSVPA